MVAITTTPYRPCLKVDVLPHKTARKRSKGATSIHASSPLETLRIAGEV